jgi:hypothetical protein
VRLALLTPAAVTHSFNTNQRYVEPIITNHFLIQGDTWSFTMRVPGNNSVVPAGFYMVAVVSGQNIPSECRWLQIGQLPNQ